MKKRLSQFLRTIAIIAFYSPITAWATQAQPVPVPEDQSINPQVEIAGVGIGSIEYGRVAPRQSGEGSINFSDSSLLIGAAQRLSQFNKGIGSFGLGGVTTDQANEGTNSGSSFYMHQAFVDLQTESFEALVGRSDNETAHLIDFPTLRGDDLITMINPLNPFSDGKNVEEHRYANVASFTFNQNLSYFENIHLQHLVDSSGLGSQTGINSFGATFEFMAPPGLEVFSRVPFWGVGYEHISLDHQSTGGLNQIYGGGVLNLNESVTDRIDLRAQDILNVGSQLTDVLSTTDTFQSSSNALAFAVRYLNSPFGRPGYQLALTSGYKNYFRVANANAFSAALTGVKRLGQGFDLVAQMKSEWRSSKLASLQSGGLGIVQAVELGFVFNFDAVLNQHLSPRRSLLNQQHQYVPN
jgi:hypothetical protein